MTKPEQKRERAHAQTPDEQITQQNGAQPRQLSEGPREPWKHKNASTTFEDTQNYSASMHMDAFENTGVRTHAEAVTPAPPRSDAAEAVAAAASGQACCSTSSPEATTPPPEQNEIKERTL